MKRTTQAIALVLVLLLTLSGCSRGGSEAGRAEGEYQTIELTMAVNGTDTQMDSRVANYFADLVEERSRGKVTVAVFPNDQLAGGNASKGLTYLGSFHNGFRQITNSKRPIKAPTDLQNLKIRVPGSEIYMGFFRTLGADPTSMSWSEVFTAIQQGTIDGQENGVSVTYTAKMAEIQDYLTMWNYSYENNLFIANTLVWESLEPKTQELLRACAKEACQWGRDTLESEEAVLLEGFKAMGMEITYLCAACSRLPRRSARS